MAVAQLKAVNIVGKLDMIDDVVIACGSSGVFQVDEASNFYSENKSFVPLVYKNPYTELLSKFDEALLFSSISVKQVSTDDVTADDEEMSEYVSFVCEKLNDLTGKKNNCLLEIEECKSNIESTGHFLGYNLEMNEISACKYIKTNFGRLPIDGYKKLSMYEDNPFVLFIPCTFDATHYWGVYISPVEHSSMVDRIFAGLYFEPFEIPGLEGTPEEYYKHLNEKLKGLEIQYRTCCENERNFISENYGKIQKIHSKLYELNAYFQIKSYALNHNGSFILAGWIPAKDEASFKERLSSVDSVDCTVRDATDYSRVTPPVMLKNVRFFRPFEFYVDMYGLPDYNEIDPTPFVALTYALLFGIMFGDLGQGLLLSVAGLFMYHKKGMKLGRIIARCGVFSALFGLVYGSVFGYEHLLDPLYRLIGFEEKPIEVMSSEATNLIIYSAIGIGIVLLMISMLMNIYSSLRRHDAENGIFGANGVAGFVFYFSIVFGMVSLFVFDKNIMNTPYVVLLLILPLLLIFLKEPLGGLCDRKPDWQPEKWGDYFAQSFFELFETVLSYATNTMSFLRVAAFVLVHAGMMMVVFTLADMSSGLGYIAIVVVGNIIVMVLEGLLVGIQVLRLEFYEMFSRFYNGRGRPFKPIHIEATTNQIQ